MNKINNGLNQKQSLFCQYYAETGNGMQSAIKAGYAAKTATITASKLLTKTSVTDEIARIRGKMEERHIATGQEVMEFFTKVMNGEIKDQFGLDASLGDRTKAAQELAKRTVDIDNRIAGKSDSVVAIKLDWRR